MSAATTSFAGIVQESFRIRAFALDEWPAYRDLRLRALEDSPDAFGSTFARERQFADELWAERLTAGVNSSLDLPLVAELNGQRVGLAWVRIDAAEGDVATLYQMWVAPEARRHGIGRALLESAITWAKQSRVKELRLRVTRGNASAQRLYAAAGFTPAGDVEPLRPGSMALTEVMRLPIGGPVPC